jgi:hypothetical protein
VVPQGLASTGMQGTLQAATDAGQIAISNLRTEAQKSVAMGQIAAGLPKAHMGIPPTGGAKGVCPVRSGSNGGREEPAAPKHASSQRGGVRRLR